MRVHMGRARIIIRFWVFNAMHLTLPSRNHIGMTWTGYDSSFRRFLCVCVYVCVCVGGGGRSFVYDGFGIEMTSSEEYPYSDDVPSRSLRLSLAKEV